MKKSELHQGEDGPHYGPQIPGPFEGGWLKGAAEALRERHENKPRSGSLEKAIKAEKAHSDSKKIRKAAYQEGRNPITGKYDMGSKR